MIVITVYLHANTQEGCTRSEWKRFSYNDILNDSQVLHVSILNRPKLMQCRTINRQRIYDGKSFYKFSTVCKVSSIWYLSRSYFYGCTASLIWWTRILGRRLNKTCSNLKLKHEKDKQRINSILILCQVQHSKWIL